MELMPLVKNILILDWKGGRVAVKYYTNEWPTVSEQRKLEKVVFNKARKEKIIKTEDNVMVIGNNIALYTLSEDLYFIVMGSEGENDLILAEVLNTFYNAVDKLPGHHYRRHMHIHCVDKSFVLQNLNSVLLLLDGFTDRGIILETDKEAILSI